MPIRHFILRHCTVIAAILLAFGLSAGKVRASDPITLTISATNFSGYQIPNDFSGLSYEAYDCAYGEHWVNGDLFSPSDTQMLTLFENMGIHNLRVGGGTSDGSHATLLLHSDVDNLFKFAQAANVNVIFSMQLLDGNAVYDATNYAKYIWTNTYSAQLQYFALGNEPDGGEWGGSYANFHSAWNAFYSTISSYVSGAPFAGPDTCCQDSWNASFANDEKGKVALFNTHDYFGGQAQNLTAAEDVDNMLSATFMYDSYETELNDLSTVQSDGYPLRFTETDDCTGGVPTASNGFASALWALDLLQWFAGTGIRGVNFHNNEWLVTDTIWENGHYGYLKVFPKGYAFKAWDLGGHGYVMPLTISNPNNADDTAYAVGNGQDLYVTIVNKFPYSNASIAACTIAPNGFQAASVSAMYLKSASANLEATNDTSLGGAIITNNAQWQGLWTPLTPCTNGQVLVDVGQHQAAVVHLRAGCAYSPPIQINENGRLEFFIITNNGDVCHCWQKGMASGTVDWNLSYSDLGPLAGGVTAVSSPVAVKNLDGTLMVFVSGSDSNVYCNYQDPAIGAWSGWNNMGGPGVTNLQAQLNPDGSVNLFGLSNGNVYYTSEKAPGIPGGTWNSLSAPSGTTIQPGFVVAQNLDGHLEVFGVDGSGNLWHIYQHQANDWNTWSSWSELSGATVNPDLQVVRNLYGCLYVFGVDATSGAIDYLDQTSSGWSSWDTTSVGAPSGLTIDPGFVVAQNGDGRFEILARGSDGNLYHNYITKATRTWSGWGAVGSGGSTPWNPQFVIGNTIDQRLQVFAIGSDNDVWSIWQDPNLTGGWSSWTDFGGNGLKFFPGQ